MRQPPAPGTERGGVLRGPSPSSRSYRSGRLSANVGDLLHTGLREVTLQVGDRQQIVHVPGSTDREAIEAALSVAPHWRTALHRATSTYCQILQLRDASNRPI